MDNLLAAGFLTIVKMFLLILLALFILFSLIVVRQVQLMNKVLAVPISGSFKFVSYALLLFATAIFVTALVIL